MRTPKNNPTAAELSISYQLYADSLIIKDAKQAHELFLKLYAYQAHQDGWCVLFLGAKQQFKCWHFLENFLDITASARNIMGTAISINAKQVIVARIDVEPHAKLSHLDILWLIQLLKTAKKKQIVLKDYLVIALEDWCSYQDEEYVN
ncbi:JAB domain-containing protein [Pedobacter sp. Hv1]|uniref:JAB domain-containing protein n=1 Tax=Pedobacter sp. Hv1 TaxID=1740090 RepID=UPI00128EB326|nr:JAB domain-containing protein [Pedobacter sp. Hv1]